MRKCSLLVLLLSFCMIDYLVAQQKQDETVIRFDANIWDFGRISEGGSKQTHTFRFVNSKNSSIVIEKVISTCGCTVADYSKKPVKPHQSGYITITLDPKGRVNYFSKILRVVCNNGKSINVLKVTGYIVPMLNPETDFPYLLSSGVFADQLVLSYRWIQQNSVPKSIEVKLYNRSMKKVNLSYIVEDESGCVKVEIPKVIMPKSIAKVSVTSVAPKGFYGSFEDKIVLFMNLHRSQLLEVYGTVIDDMRSVSLHHGPKLRLSSVLLDFGQVKSNQILKRIVELTNEGEQPLIIRKIECNEEVKANVKGEFVLSKGESRQIIFTVFPKYKRNKILRENVKIVSNDPKRTVQNIQFLAHITE